MRLLFIASFVANILLALVSLAILPSRVATHFGANGLADGWMPGPVNALIQVGMNALVFLLIYFSPHLVFALPARWVNLPNKQYWLKAENRARTRAILESLMWRFGTAIFLFLLVLGLLTLQANLSDPVRLDEQTFLPVFAVFMVYSVYWCVMVFRAFRIPKGETDGA